MGHKSMYMLEGADRIAYNKTDNDSPMLLQVHGM